MSHFLHSLAQHWHLSASQYWQLRLICAITLGPLLGVVCLVLFTKREKASSGMLRRKQPTRLFTLHPAAPSPL
ncbi:MAG: hypothetical protein EOO63_01265 [Hymenobacter sp.]|nr:MAG: hypothetical protein EOO63_01265 [Hymenobacter sp.]